MSSSGDSAKIDVHHHFLPPPFVAGLYPLNNYSACKTDVFSALHGGQVTYVPQWNPDLSEETLQSLGCRSAILAVSTPGPEVLSEELQVELCRESNRYAAALRDKKPQKFGFFAMIPSLLHTEAALAEIRYALDDLNADGVSLFTSYGEGEFYLGNPCFEPIWRELDARSAVVHTHPIESSRKTLPDPRMVQPFLDYPSETAQMALSMIITGTKRKYSNCRIILSHGGGTLPALIHRVSYMWPHYYPEFTTQQIEEDFKSFYFDTALAGTKNTLDLLFNTVPRSHILFGSDFPYAPYSSIVRMTNGLEDYNMNREQREDIYYKNALRLFPRLEH